MITVLVIVAVVLVVTFPVAREKALELGNKVLDVVKGLFTKD